MNFFRSEPMSLCQILLHTESAFNCLVELGQIGKVQWRQVYDDNAVCNNRYNADIQRCNDLQFMINYLENDMKDFDIKMIYYPNVDVEEAPNAYDVSNAEKHIESVYRKISEVKKYTNGIRRQCNMLLEKEQVLLKANEFLTGARGTEPVLAFSDSIIRNLMHDESLPTPRDSLSISFFAGTIEVQRFAAFERMVYRTTRGNFYIRFADVSYNQNESGLIFKSNIKYVFMLFFIGKHLREKLSKLCQGFGIRLFDCPESSEDRNMVTLRVQKDLEDLKKVIQESEKQRYTLLLIAASDLYIWKVKIKKALMVFFVLNHMRRLKRLQMEKYLQSECWVPTSDIRNVRDALQRGVDRTASDKTVSMFPAMIIELDRQQVSDEEKPTLFRLNRFTQGFQNLIDAYGVAAYRELNPAPYTIVTFPFLFAVMFGDIGHGLIITIFSFFMIIKEKRLEEEKRTTDKSNEIWNIMFAGRYIIFLMGIFSIYTGFIYNDIFSKSLNIFGSRWHLTTNVTVQITTERHYQLDPRRHYKGDPYWFGMDPVWDAAGENSITTFNSLKMKMAVILGVTQMVFGLLLSAVNHILKQQYSEFFLVFIPQIVFLLCIFFYLVFMIFFKWVNFGGHYPSPYNSACAPSILIIFINMLLMKQTKTAQKGCKTWMYPGQSIVQSVLLYTALISVPILLAGRPLHILYQRRKLRKLQNEESRMSRKLSTASSIRRTLIYNVDPSQMSMSYSKSIPQLQEQPSPEKQDMFEVWIHSGIHCIESVLGSVSHTASYLRLWALSLAHDQLSTVLWKMVLSIGLVAEKGYWNAITLFIVFFFWAVLTVAILVVMEGLSAFLHTLRLHWVEFQSKFYSGSGVKFSPFVFPESTMHG